MRDEFYAKPGIFSSTLTPDRINSMLGIKCDKGYLTGDRRGGTIIREKENSWIIYSRVPRDFPLKDHIEDILERVAPVANKIRKITDQPDTEVELGCVIHAIKEPPLFFSREQVSILCEMGASIDVDLYFWQRGSEEASKEPDTT
jgi:hypothetical protein